MIRNLGAIFFAVLSVAILPTVASADPGGDPIELKKTLPEKCADLGWHKQHAPEPCDDAHCRRKWGQCQRALDQDRGKLSRARARLESCERDANKPCPACVCPSCDEEWRQIHAGQSEEPRNALGGGLAVFRVPLGLTDREDYIGPAVSYERIWPKWVLHVGLSAAEIDVSETRLKSNFCKYGWCVKNVTVGDDRWLWQGNVMLKRRF